MWWKKATATVCCEDGGESERKAVINQWTNVPVTWWIQTRKPANSRGSYLTSFLSSFIVSFINFSPHILFGLHVVDTPLNAWTCLTWGGVLKYCEYETRSSIYSILCNTVANTDKFSWWWVYTLTSSWTWFQGSTYNNIYSYIKLNLVPSCEIIPTLQSPDLDIQS